MDLERVCYERCRACLSAGKTPETVKCHSERSGESRSVPGGPKAKDRGEIPRCARDDSLLQGRSLFEVLNLE